MWPYYILILLPIIVQHIKLQGAYVCISTGKRNNMSMKLFWGLLLIMLFLRHESVGIDLSTYKNIFNMISRSNWKEALGRSAEIGYSAFNKLVSLFTNDFRWIIVISAILSVYFVAKAYIKYSNDSSLTIALFITISNFVLLFSGLRQAIAISLGFVAFEFVRKKRLILFIIIVVIAMLFHTSAFMLLFMYPLYYARITKKWIPGVVLALSIIFIFNKQIFNTLILFLSRFTKYEGAATSTGAYTMLILFSILAVFSYVIPDELKLDSDIIGMRNFLLFSVTIQMFAPLNNLAMRMNYYYIAFIPLLIPKIIENRSSKWSQVGMAGRHIMVVFLVLYFFVNAPKVNALQTFPYHFLWEKF